MTSIPVLSLVQVLGLLHKAGKGCLDAFVSELASLLHSTSHFLVALWAAALVPCRET